MVVILANINLLTHQKLICLEEQILLLGYAGTIGISHGIDNVCKYVQMYNHSFNNNLHLYVVGSGSKFIDFKYKYECSQITFMERISQELVNDFYASIDFSLVSLLNIKPYDHVIPSKLFESLAYKTPILGGLRGEAKNIIISNKVGETFNNDCYESFCLSINLLIKNKSQYSHNIDKARLKYSRDLNADHSKFIIVIHLMSAESRKAFDLYNLFK